jgi:hypothetical protein
MIYAPVAGIVLFSSVGLWFLWFGIKHHKGEITLSGYLTLVLLSASLTAFPQYFFFRPDQNHLSEFMPGYIAASVGIVLLLWKLKIPKPCTLALGVCVAVHCVAYLFVGLNVPYMGSMADGKSKDRWFVANGVSVWVGEGEYQGFSILRDAIQKFASPSDYVLCYPYMPGINFMTNRRTYQWSLFVDNTVCGDDFYEESIAGIERYKPAVIVTNDMAINGTADSMFSNWAAPTKAYIREHYFYRGSVMGNEVYTLSRQ